MSKTDNTRPYSVLEGDRLAKRIGSDPTFSGMTGNHGHAKEIRDRINSVRRQQERAACHLARKMLNPMDFDLPPFWGDRKCVAYILD